MKYKTITLLLLMMLSPTVTSASCNVNGYTVVYVNGILTDEQEAKDDKKALERKYIEAGEPSGHLIFLNGHNPSHFAGGGDLYKSAQQTLEKAAATVVADYDLKTILMQIPRSDDEEDFACRTFARHILYQRHISIFSRARNAGRISCGIQPRNPCRLCGGRGAVISHLKMTRQ